MTVEIGNLPRRDYATAVAFAMEGGAFVPCETLRRACAWWLWYEGLRRATQVIGAYDGDRLLGVLLARMRGGKTRPLPLGARLVWRAMDVVVTVVNLEAGHARAKQNMRQHGTSDPVVERASDLCKRYGSGGGERERTRSWHSTISTSSSGAAS